MPLVDRFWAKVDKNGPVPAHRPELGPCWLFTGSRDDKGYGQIREGGRGSRLIKAHRLGYVLQIGPVADDVLVLHKCDNPPCARGEHLFTGTFGDNSRDAAAKGRLIFQAHPERIARGEKAWAAKLTAADVEEMRTLRADGWTQVRLAARFGVTQANVSAILTGLTWRTANV
jgi:hypothetical protein